MKKALAATTLTALTLLAAAGCGGSSLNGANSGGAERVAAGELHRAYKADLRKAEEAYKGKNLTVTGTAHSYADQGDGKRLQILSYGEGTDTFAITCYSNDPQWVKDVAAVKLSQAVAFSGTLARFGDKSAEFTNCRIAK